jgi:RHS repeat-associated protein
MLLSLNYGYGASAGKMGNGSTPGNSGQLVSVTGTINSQNRNQAFTYDNVGRLATATGWEAWARRFDYDQYGNRTAVWDAASGGNQLQNTVIGQVAGIKTNRIASVNGTTFSHDASGNMTGDGARTYTYDAENRIVSVSGAISESYGYDAGNRRVKKEAEGVVTHYIWEGRVIAEYERGGATPAAGTRYYHQDRLSTRIITDSAGAVVGTTNHLPFGEEIGVSGQEEKRKFTTYERDRTGLDYAVNRYHDPRQGRFNQVDPLGMGASSLADPQSLNLYSYAQNDPINLNDPTGLYVEAPMFVDDGYGGMGGFTGGFARGGGGGGGTTCYIDGIQSSCGMASRLLESGAGVIGPSNTTRWDPELNQGKGGFKHFRVDANGKASWGYWSEVTTRGVDDARNELWSYTDTEWHMTLIGDLTFRNGMLGVDTSGVHRDFNGDIITGGERPIEMQMLGPLDYIGVGEFKAGAAIFASVLAFSRVGLKSVAKELASNTLEATVRSQDEAAELFLRLFQGRGYRNTTGMTGNMVRNDKFLFPNGKYGTYHWDFADTMHGGIPHLQIHLFKEEGGGIIRIFFPR